MKKTIVLLFTIFAVLFFISCSGNGSEITNNCSESITTLSYDAARDSSPDVSDDEIASLTAGNNEFATDVFKKSADSTGNIVFSPYSLSITLAMTWGGARNQTETDMSNTLNFPFDRTKLHAVFNAVDLALKSRSQTDSFDLHIVNQLWGEKTKTFETDYLKLIKVNYGAGLNLLDFINMPDSSRIVINDWVSENTYGKISDLLPTGSITVNTRLVLTNAIYFNAIWADTFKKEDTTTRGFMRLSGDTVNAKFMSRKGSYKYDSTEDCQIIEMPYKGGRTSMIIILPAAGKMQTVESGLSNDYLNSLYSSMSSVDVMLILPKFKFATGSISFGDILASLGMSIAFGDYADFSGIDGGTDLAISDVLQKAYISIDERGTEAAVSTAVMLIDSAAIPENYFVADRPFIFLIRDIPTNTILFMGKLIDPTAGTE
jgi:serpin B